MNEVSTIDARARFSDVVNRASYGKERIILTRRGKPIAAVVPIEDVEALEEIEDRIDLEEARKVLAEGGPTIPLENLKRELGIE